MPQGFRVITVNDEVWRFRIGDGYALLESPSGTRQVVSLLTLTGRSADTLDRGRWKKTSDGMVTPRHVATFIRSLRELPRLEARQAGVRRARS